MEFIETFSKKNLKRSDYHKRIPISKFRGQGTIEYVFMLAGALLIVALTSYFLMNSVFKPQTQTMTKQSAQINGLKNQLQQQTNAQTYGQTQTLAPVGTNPSGSNTPSASPSGFDSLSFTTGQQKFPTLGTDYLTTGSFVHVASTLPNAFNFGNFQTSDFYYITSSTPAGSAIQGIIFYLNPTNGNYVPYTAPDAVTSTNPAQVTSNDVPYQYAPGSSVNIQFNANGIDLGNPDLQNFVIFVPEITQTGQQAFQLDVGFGDSTQPTLASSSGGSGISYG